MSQLQRELNGQIYAMFSGLANIYGFFNNENPRLYTKKAIFVDIMAETCVLLSGNGPKLLPEKATDQSYILRTLVYHTYFFHDQELMK